MCGRYVATSPPGVLAEYFAVDGVRAEPPGPSWNVAPTDPVPAVLVRREQRLLGWLRWGLVPSWSKDTRGAARTINARAESLVSKPAFRSAFARRRCLLPADGFYEWERRPDRSTQPWYFHRADGAPLAMAGLWEVWRDPAVAGRQAGRQTEGDAERREDGLLRTCAVVTTGANTLMAPIHDRMPVLLEPGDWATWLDPTPEDNTDVHRDALVRLLVPADPRLLDCYRITTRINSVRNNDAGLLEPVPAEGTSTVEPR
jgi:putative SOS response-associated peptidase YedK